MQLELRRMSKFCICEWPYLEVDELIMHLYEGTVHKWAMKEKEPKEESDE